MNIKGYKKIYAIIGLVLYLCTYGSLVVSAQTLPDYTVLAPLPGTTKDCNQNDPNANCTTNFKTYLEGMFKLLIGVSAILAFVMLVYAGFLYTTSEGMGQTTNARSKIEDAIWGLILVIGAYAILNTINPKILEFNLSIKRPEIEATSTPGVTTGILPTTQAAIDDLRSKCNCSASISSANDGQHDPDSTHYKGTGVDILPETKLNQFILKNDSLKECGRYPVRLGGQDATFLWEPKGSYCGGKIMSNGDHWHVTVSAQTIQ